MRGARPLIGALIALVALGVGAMWSLAPELDYTVPPVGAEREAVSERTTPEAATNVSSEPAVADVTAATPAGSANVEPVGAGTSEPNEPAGPATEGDADAGHEPGEGIGDGVSSAATWLPAADADIELPGLSGAIVAAATPAAFASRLHLRLEIENQSGAGLDVVRIGQPWAPCMRISVRFESPPSDALTPGVWYVLAAQRGYAPSGPARSSLREMVPGETDAVDLPLVQVKITDDARTATLWAGRLTESHGEFELKVESLDDEERVTATLGRTFVNVAPAPDADSAAVERLRELGLWHSLGPYGLPWVVHAEGMSPNAMTAFLESHPDTSLRDEARLALAIAIHRNDFACEIDPVTVLRELATESGDVDLSLWAVCWLAQIHRDRRDLEAMRDALALADRAPERDPLVEGELQLHRKWLARRLAKRR